MRNSEIQIPHKLGRQNAEAHYFHQLQPLQKELALIKQTKIILLLKHLDQPHQPHQGMQNNQQIAANH